jgi:hypothetical protein
MDGYISPYASGNWGSVSNILKTLDDTSRLPALSDRIDPNKIFTSDISALRVLAADQQKITKMFEKKLVEGLTERGKVGLDENDIMAMQALTAARSAVTNINEKQITIKKHIADIKIKQQSTSDGNYNSSDSSTGKGLSAYDVGRSMMDSIFEHGNAVIPTTEYTPAASTDDASQLIEDLIPTPSTSIKYNSSNILSVCSCNEKSKSINKLSNRNSSDKIIIFTSYFRMKSSISSFLLLSKPGSTFSPALFHNKNDLAAELKSLALINLRTDDLENAPCPIL